MGKRPAAVVAAGAGLAVLSGCGSYVHDVGGSPTYSAVPESRSVRVEVRAGCPSGLGRAQDVRNSEPKTLRFQLVRSGATSGIVCVYAAGDTGRSTKLVDTVRLNDSRAAELSKALAGVTSHEVHGDVGCPAEHFGAITIIALHYEDGPDVDVWYKTSGCQTLRNGITYRGEVANKSFYDGFRSVFDGIVSEEDPSESHSP